MYKIKKQMESFIMNKIRNIIFILMTLIFSTTNVNADVGEEEIDCLDGEIYSLKIEEGFDKSDLKNVSGLKPCNDFLKKQDHRLNIYLDILSSKKSVQENKGLIESKYGDFDNVLSSVEEENKLSYIIDALSYLTISVISIYLIFLVFTSMSFTKGSNQSKAVLLTLTLALVSFASFNFEKGLTTLSIYLSAKLNYVIVSSSDYSSAEEVSNFSGQNKRLAVMNKSNQDLIGAMLYQTTLKRVTDNSYRQTNLMSNIEIDVDLFGNGKDTKNPTIRQYTDYENNCLNTQVLEIDNDYNLHIMDFDITKQPDVVTFEFGGETEEYNCESNHFGLQSQSMKIVSKDVELLKSFLLKEYELNDGKVGITSEIKAAMDSSLSNSVKALDTATEKGSTNTSNLTNEIELAKRAVVAARNDNTSKDLTSEGKALLKMIKRGYGSIFKYNKDDFLEPLDIVEFNTIKQQRYMFSRFFGETDDVDIINENIYKNGYYYLNEFLNETIDSAFDYECAIKDGGNFLLRKKSASTFNEIFSNKTVKKNNISVLIDGDINCYSFDKDTYQIKALGNPEEADLAKQNYEDNVNALNYLFEVYKLASIELISEDEDLKNDVLLKYLDSLDTYVQSAANSNLLFVEAQNKIYRMIERTSQSLDITIYNGHDFLKPATYFNYNRFLKNTTNVDFKTFDQRNGNKYYDLSKMFIHFNKVNKEQKEEISMAMLKNKMKDGLKSFQDADFEMMIKESLKPECPIINSDGSCEVSLYQLLNVNTKNMAESSGILFATTAATSFASGTCNAATGGGSDGFNVGSVASFSLAKLPCLAIEGTDALLTPVLRRILDGTILLTIAGVITSFIPTIVDFFITIMPIVIILPAIFSFFVVMIMEVIRNTASAIMSENEDQVFTEFTNFKGTIHVLKSTLIRLCVVLVAPALYLSLIMSKAIGGFAYNSLLNTGDSLLIFCISIVAFYTFVIVMSFYLLKMLFRMESEFLKSLEIKNEGIFTFSDRFGAAMSGFVFGQVLSSTASTTKIALMQSKFKGQKLAQDSAEKEYNNVDNPKKKTKASLSTDEE